MRIRTLALLVSGVAALGLSVAVVGHVGPFAEATFHGTQYMPPEPAADFRLTDHRGQPASLADYRGEAVLLFFGFTHCPDACPLTLTKLSRVLGTLGDDAEDVRILLVTTDPERDTPEALAEYVGRFDAPIDGLTGDDAALAALRAAYGVFAGPNPMQPAMGMTHTTAVFGIDRAGALRVLLPMGEPEAAIASDIRSLLRL